MPRCASADAGWDKSCSGGGRHDSLLGGAGQLFRYTTNPDIATGEGIAIALRAGAEIRDVELVQFHPTALCYPGAPRFLISEAVRGEGAILRNMKGERFMARYHKQLELAPRDVVARAILDEMEATKSTFVYIDITHESEEFVKRRFPTIYDFCQQFGLDLSTDWIPVAPAAHYMMGGVKTDLHGETTMKGLFACGEVSARGESAGQQFAVGGDCVRAPHYRANRSAAAAWPEGAAALRGDGPARTASAVDCGKAA